MEKPKPFPAVVDHTGTVGERGAGGLTGREGALHLWILVPPLLCGSHCASGSSERQRLLISSPVQTELGPLS